MIFICLGLLVAALCVVHPPMGLYAVALTIPLETWTLPVGGLHPKLYQAGLALTAAALVARTARHGLNARRVLIAPLIPLLLTTVICEMVHWQYIQVGIGLVALQLILFGLIATVSVYAEDITVLTRIGWCLVAAGTLEATLGLGQVATFYAGGKFYIPGQSAYQTLILAGRPAGTFTEPDFFAAFLAAALAIGAGLRPRVEKGSGLRPLVDASLIVLTTCLVLSLVRAAWIAVICTLIVYALSRGWTRTTLPRLASARAWMAMVAILTVLVGGLALAAPQGFQALIIRGQNLLAVVEPENAGSVTRQGELDGLYAAISESPIVGHGIGTYGLLTTYGRRVAADTGREAGVPGAAHLLGILYEQGAIGLGALLILLFYIGARLKKALRGGADGALVARAMMMGGTAAFVSGLVNNDYYFGFFWLTLALAAAVGPNSRGRAESLL